MVTTLRFLLGFGLGLLGFIYFFRPYLVLHLNAFIRNTLFNDAHVLLRHRRIGSVLLLVGGLLIILTLRMPR